jgi:hypothetical protein
MTPDQARLVERILRGELTDLQTNLVELSRYWKIRVWFSTPVEVRITSRRVKKTNVHIFARFFDGNLHGICYQVNRKYRHGYPIGDWLRLIVKYEPVFEMFDDEFKSYEQFRAKFDLYFITEEQIQSLWNGTSSQHGGKYRKSDFHRIGRKGKTALNEFLRFFKGISKGADVIGGAPGYMLETEGKYFILRKHLGSSHHFGRDITISHQTNIDTVFYSSEFYGCGNGRYGLLANRNEFLWIEDD